MNYYKVEGPVIALIKTTSKTKAKSIYKNGTKWKPESVEEIAIHKAHNFIHKLAQDTGSDPQEIHDLYLDDVKNKKNKIIYQEAADGYQMQEWEKITG